MRASRQPSHHFVTLILLTTVCSFAFAAAARATPERDDRPNIVFILIDDLAYKAMGFTGRYPFLETPHIDRLAREGARFANAFVTTSLCSPARASFLTGMHAHRHGVRTNRGDDLDPTIPTFPQLLQRNGYRTAFVGKWHMGRTSDPRPGFDHWLSFRGQGNYYDPRLNENGRVFEPGGYMTDRLTEHATDWLEKQADVEEPFMLYLSHKAVHGPFEPAERHRNALAGARAPKPENFDDDYADKPRWLRRASRYGARRKQWAESEGKPVPEKVNPGNWNGGNIDYFECILSVDDSVGRVLDTLESQGQLEETMVIFTSDNGFFLGRHHRGDKRLAYESSIRIPMLVRYPPMVEAGSAIKPMTLNIDVAPTLLDLAGVRPPERMQGRSFLPLLRGEEPSDWREAFFYTYYKEGWLAGLPTLHAVRTGRWKHITAPELPDQIDELYDLEKDPYELNNLATDPGHRDRLAEMHSLLEQFKERMEYISREEALARKLSGVPTELALRYGPKGGSGRLIDATGQGHHAAWNNAHFASSPFGEAAVFEGDSVAKYTPEPGAFDPGNKPLTVGAWIRPAEASGVIYAHGGRSHGLSLYIEEGVPHFAARVGGGLHTVRGEKPVPMKEWTHLAGQITERGEIRLLVDGKAVAIEDARPLATQPNDGVTIGADTGSRVTEHDLSLHYRGRIADLRVYWGRPDRATLRKWATR